MALAGAGAAAFRRCGMAAAPPSSLSYRTTGSTCLHPLSQLLGIPLDQVSAVWGARPLPEPVRAWSLGGKCYLPLAPPHSRFYSYKPDRWAFFFCFSPVSVKNIDVPCTAGPKELTKKVLGCLVSCYQVLKSSDR